MTLTHSCCKNVPLLIESAQLGKQYKNTIITNNQTNSIKICLTHGQQWI